jgi:hypothetical protein
MRGLARASSDDVSIIRDSSRFWLAVPFEGGRTGEETEANLNLIAAAPELFAALNDLVWLCDDPNGSERDESLTMGLVRLLPAARAAIAKARGESA